MISEINTRTNVITKAKPSFLIPVLENFQGIVIKEFEPELFNTADELFVLIKREYKDGLVEFSDPEPLIEFTSGISAVNKFIPFKNESGNTPVLLAIEIAHKHEKTGITEIKLADPDKLHDFKLLVLYTYKK